MTSVKGGKTGSGRRLDTLRVRLIVAWKANKHGLFTETSNGDRNKRKNVYLISIVGDLGKYYTLRGVLGKTSSVVVWGVTVELLLYYVYALEPVGQSEAMPDGKPLAEKGVDSFLSWHGLTNQAKSNKTGMD